MRKIMVVAVIIVVLLAVGGCGDKPSGEPRAIATQYVENIENGNLEGAYNLLCSENQSQISLEEFKDWRYNCSELFKAGANKIVKEEELGKYSFNNVDYPFAYKYNLTSTDYNYLTEKDEPGDYEKIVVAENKEWKIFDEDNYRGKYAWSLCQIGWAYREGKSFDTNVNTSITYFLKAIKVDPDYADTYYHIAYAYDSKEQYDKALEYIDIGITKETDEEYLSDMYNFKGCVLQTKWKFEEAKTAYRKAIELNPENIYANDNLDSIE